MIQLVQAKDKNDYSVSTVVFDAYPLLDFYLKTHTGDIVAVQQVSNDEFYIYEGDYTLDNLGFEAQTEDGKIHRAFIVESSSGTFMWGLINSKEINPTPKE